MRTKTSAPSRTSAPPPARVAPPPHHAPPAHAPPMQQGPGLMGTMAATAAGSVAGNAIGNMLFGGRSNNETVSNNQEESRLAQNPCAPQLNQFIQCVESNGNDVNSCQWSWNGVAQCRQSYPQLL